MSDALGLQIREARERLAFDARHFLEALYHGQPEGTVIAVGGLTRPHFCYSAADALPWVTGQQDVYARITLLGARPKSGRGSAADSAYLPGVWAEVDINGGPKASGGVVTDGAPDLEAALELCHAILQPTLVVRSGYGLHAYWLFEAPLDIREPEARDHAGELVAGWQRRLRQAADFALDSTHDLARVFRPAGTFNGKGGEPMPVTLLDDGGPRYTVEAIEAEVLAPAAPVVPLVAPVAEPGVARKPDELMARYAAVARIARREGKAPGGGSESDWDYYLACEARRRVKPPISRDEAIELVAYGRRKHGDDPKGKAERGDYLEVTVDKVFAAVKAPDMPAPSSADPLAVINTTWRLADDPVVDGWAIGNGLAAKVFLRRESGDVIRLRKLGDLFTATKHVAQVAMALPGVVLPDLSKPVAVRAAQAIRDVCTVRDDDEVDRLEVVTWLGSFVQGLGAIFTGDLLGEGEPRWRVLTAQRDFQPHEPVHGIAAATAGVRDLGGRLWIPSGPFMRHVWKVEGASVAWPELRTRVTDLGWSELRVDVHEPGTGKSKVGAAHIGAVFYGEPGTIGG